MGWAGALAIGSASPTMAVSTRLTRIRMVHLLETKAFATQFQHSIIIMLSTAGRVRLHEMVQLDCKVVANLDHCSPPPAYAFQVFFSFCAQDHNTINSEQFRLELPRLLVERRTEVFGNSR